MCNGCRFDGVESLPSHDGRLEGMSVTTTCKGVLAMRSEEFDMRARQDHATAEGSMPPLGDVEHCRVELEVILERLGQYSETSDVQ